MLCEWSSRRAFDACLRGGKKPRLGASAVDKKEMLAESSISRSPKGSLVGSLVGSLLPAAATHGCTGLYGYLYSARN